MRLRQAFAAYAAFSLFQAMQITVCQLEKELYIQPYPR
jgi:hypothetical protein